MRHTAKGGTFVRLLVLPSGEVYQLGCGCCLRVSGMHVHRARIRQVLPCVLGLASVRLLMDGQLWHSSSGSSSTARYQPAGAQCSPHILREGPAQARTLTMHRPAMQEQLLLRVLRQRAVQRALSQRAWSTLR